MPDKFGYTPQEQERHLQRWIVVNYPGAPVGNHAEFRPYLVVDLRDCIVERAFTNFNEARDYASQKLNAQAEQDDLPF